MHRLIKSFYIILLLPLVIACSTKKNTGATRFYHNLTSRYNILFNGEESYKKGMQRLVDTYQDNYTELLPVFLYTDEEALAGISPEMDRAIKKATKLIGMHSLTVKPEIKPDKQLSQKQKEFYSQKEFNKYVDDAYLLMGKAHFYKLEFGMAKETFNFIILNFPDNPSAFESRLWLARLANEEERFREAADILNSLSNSIEFPKHLEGELQATWADHFIKLDQVDKAIDPLIKAEENTRNKKYRVRYTFLIAQLYALNEQNLQATEYFGKVISMNPPYEMTFAAKINRALTYQSGAGSAKDIEKQLHKMLRDDKNIEYQDQIYYALGNIYYKNKDVPKAIENYEASLLASTDNYNQQALTNLTLADIYYARPDYVQAQAYYDSAVAVIDIDYPDYQAISVKAVSLTQLVESMQTVHFEDSVLKLADMPRDDLMVLINDIIEDEIEADEARKRMEAQLAEERAENLMNANIQNLERQGGWYFYNPTAKSLGKKEFARQWGSRKLEDNWRRRNKNVVDFEILANNEDNDPDDVEETTPGVVVTNWRKPDFYLQYIPFTDSAKAASLKRIEEGLFNMGRIYDEDLKDFPEATQSYEELLRRFPTYNNRLQVYYNLYLIAKETQDIERVSTYQQKIISEFPNSNFAKLMTNPNYLSEVRAEESRFNREYEQIVDLFNARRYNQAIPLAQRVMDQNPDHELYPNLDYMHTISSGIRKDTLTFIKDLQRLQSAYPGTQIADNAQVMINYLQSEAPEVVEKQNMESARELYKITPDETHFFAFIAPSKINAKQLEFNIKDFNIENYDRQRLDVKSNNIKGGNMLCVVQQFSDSKAAMAYLRDISDDNSIFRDVDSEAIIPIIISRTNYNTLRESGKTSQYVLFFQQNYP